MALSGELKGGFASALVGLAIALTLGLLAFGSLGAGETLFREGEPGDRVYVLTRGSVTIMTGKDSKAQRIGTF